MRQKQTENSTDNYSARKRVRKRRCSPVRAITILCVLLGVFWVYSDNKQITPPSNVLAGYQTETLSTNTIAPGFNQRVISTGEIPAANRLAANLQINSANAALMDLTNGTILFDKNGAAKMYPASLTKIMTAIVALEHIKDLNKKVFLNEAIFKPIYEADAATAGFLPGESVRVIDLLYGLLLPSGAECAVGLAEYVAGSESAFVSLMNDKAHEIGMNGSNFTNATGLHDKNHYSTALDMAVLLQYALNDGTFYKIFTSSRHSTPSTNQRKGGITYYSTLFAKINNPAFDGGSILGGKTGYTVEAGQCLASLAVKDGNKYILITSGAPGDNQTQELHIDDAFTVYAAISKERGFKRIAGLEELD